MLTRDLPAKSTVIECFLNRRDEGNWSHFPRCDPPGQLRGLIERRLAGAA
jgi:hypothetical protein